MAAVSFGLAGLTAQSPTGDPTAAGRAIRTAVAAARVAEECGFDSVWTAEHHGAEDGFMPAPLVLLSAIAANTVRVTLGTNVLVAPLWDPIRLAEEAAIVDHLSAGRLVLGLGVGYMEHEFAALGADYPSRGDRTEEIVAAVRAAWRGEPISSAAGPDRAGIAVTPPPLGEPPIYIGGFVRRSVERAVRLGAGYLGPTVGVDGLAERIAWAESFDAPQGFVISVTAFASLHVDTSEPRPTPHKYVAPRPDSAGTPVRAVGNIDECVDQLAPLVRCLAEMPDRYTGLLNMCLIDPALDTEANLDTVRRFGNEALPALREIAWLR